MDARRRFFRASEIGKFLSAGRAASFAYTRTTWLTDLTSAPATCGHDGKTWFPDEDAMSEKIAYSRLSRATPEFARHRFLLRAVHALRRDDQTSAISTASIARIVRGPRRNRAACSMDFAAFTRVADQIADMGGVRLNLLHDGRTPPVNRGCRDFIRIAREKGIAKPHRRDLQRPRSSTRRSRQVIEAGHSITCASPSTAARPARMPARRRARCL